MFRKQNQSEPLDREVEKSKLSKEKAILFPTMRTQNTSEVCGNRSSDSGISYYLSSKDYIPTGEKLNVLYQMPIEERTVARVSRVSKRNKKVRKLGTKKKSAAEKRKFLRSVFRSVGVARSCMKKSKLKPTASRFVKDKRISSCCCAEELKELTDNRLGVSRENIAASYTLKECLKYLNEKNPQPSYDEKCNNWINIYYDTTVNNNLLHNKVETEASNIYDKNLLFDLKDYNEAANVEKIKSSDKKGSYDNLNHKTNDEVEKAATSTSSQQENLRNVPGAIKKEPSNTFIEPLENCRPFEDIIFWQKIPSDTTSETSKSVDMVSLIWEDFAPATAKELAFYEKYYTSKRARVNDKYTVKENSSDNFENLMQLEERPSLNELCYTWLNQQDVPSVAIEQVHNQIETQPFEMYNKNRSFEMSILNEPINIKNIKCTKIHNLEAQEQSYTEKCNTWLHNQNGATIKNEIEASNIYNKNNSFDLNDRIEHKSNQFTNYSQSKHCGDKVNQTSVRIYIHIYL